MKAPQGALRKAAILIGSLDAHGADALLEQMSPEQAARVRSAVVALGDVDPAEQETIIDEFLRGGGRTSVEPPDGVELDTSLARKIALSRHHPEPPAAPAIRSSTAETSTSPFRSLQEADLETLGRFLEREQPQTIAAVVAQLPPQRAGEVIKTLNPALRSDVLHRMADLDSMDPDVRRDVEQELETLLARHSVSPQRSPGFTAVSAMLAAMNGTDRHALLSELATRDVRLANRLEQHSPPVAEAIEPVRPDTNPDPRFRLVPGSQAPPSVASHPTVVAPSEHFELNDQDLTDIEPDLDADFADVVTLDDRSLAVLLRNADPQVTLLALAGAEQKFVNRILKQLSRTDAHILQRRIRQVGPVRLSDVEAAQTELAQIANELVEHGRTSRTTRRLMRAA